MDADPELGLGRFEAFPVAVYVLDHYCVFEGVVEVL